MQRLVLSVLITFLLMAPQTVMAQQANPEAAEILVDIWPEYDRPDVLVIYRITLSAETQLPARVKLRIPSAAGEPFNVAMQENGSLYTLKYDTTLRGDWLEVSFITPSLEVQVEYYDPSFNRDRPERSFIFRWAGDLAVHSINVQVQQPVNASPLVIIPDMGSGVVGSDGLTYYDYPVGSVEAGTPFEIQLSYHKTDDTLTFSSGGSVAPSQPVDQNTSGRTSFTPLLYAALGALVLLLFGGGIFWFLQIRKKKAKLVLRAEIPARRTAAAPTTEPGDIYCHKCGKRADLGDLFCRVCGTRLRSE